MTICFPVLLDSNVLAESAVSDLFLRLAEDPKLLSPRWTESIWQETRRTLIQKLSWPTELVDSRFLAATEAFPEAMISGYESLLGNCENDPRDRHILAAAISERIDIIVTMNIRHFKTEHLEPSGITAMHPDELLLILYDLSPESVQSVLGRMAELRGYDLAQMLSRLSASVPRFSAFVGRDLGLTVPAYRPRR